MRNLQIHPVTVCTRLALLDTYPWSLICFFDVHLAHSIRYDKEFRCKIKADDTMAMLFARYGKAKLEKQMKGNKIRAKLYDLRLMILLVQQFYLVMDKKSCPSWITLLPLQRNRQFHLLVKHNSLSIFVMLWGCLKWKIYLYFGSPELILLCPKLILCTTYCWPQ